jgi:hypothetical protein
MNNSPICPCEGFTHPQVIFNPPGQETIAYRVGDYISFRRALLQSLANENELTQWRPGSKRDLAVQIVEWWAYLADILTFYNERIANESYLQTADLPENIQNLIQILGYRPRPGIGARGVVAALINSPKPFTLPQGFQIQSKPGPGKQPQIFELDVDTQIQILDALATEPLPNLNLDPSSVLLKGSVTTVKVGDEVLLLKRNWNGTDNDYALATVQVVQLEKDPHGNTNTFLSLTLQQSGVPAGVQVQDYLLLRSNQSAHLYLYKTDHTIASDHLHLESIQRDIKVGDPLLLENPAQIPKHRLVSVTKYTEFLWYANTPNPANPTQPPDANTEPAVPILHTRPYFKPLLSASLATQWDTDRDKILVRLNWQEIGQLIAKPEATFDGMPPTLKLTKSVQIPATNDSVSLLIEDTESKGISAKGRLGKTLDLFNLSALPLSPFSLKSPLSLLFNCLPVSRGQTVTNEVLGSGNASLAGQEFILSKSPLTYLLDPESTSGKDYKSTLRIWVNDIEWQEVPSFYGQPADARVFVTREDIDQKTHVLFGDWVNGAGLPTGSDNVVTTYRYGSGQEAPEAGTLNVIVKPYPNLKAIRNPVVVGGGAAPDPPEQIRRYAPRSVLTFDRAVSGDDYETIAAQAPGVARARAYWTWDDHEQRSLVVIYVGDDANAVTAASTALRNAADPNRLLLVKRAIGISIQINLSVQIEPTYAPPPVLRGVRNVLLDSDRGLFGTNNMQIGQSVYQSQIFATCLQVPGVLAVHGLQFWIDSGSGFGLDPPYRHDPGEGKFYQLATENLNLTAEVMG